MSSGRRPEYQAPPEMYYNEVEARKYTSNSRIISVQQQLSERAVELLGLPEGVPSLILDLGCGSGLSGDALTEAGHTWIGVDISRSMLDVAQDREVDGDLVLGDLGQGVGFRAGAFDGVISISTLQWLCNADKTTHNPVKRLYALFSSLYACLSRGSRAVFQFYPENENQVELITKQALRAGFTGGLVIDHPESTKAKKIFLTLFTGGGSYKLPQGLSDSVQQENENTISYSGKRIRTKQIRGKPPKKSAAWIQEKKERRRRQFKETRADSKFTGRKRCGKF